MGAEAVAVALHAGRSPYQAPWHRSAGSIRRRANTETIPAVASLHRIMATPELPALRQPRRPLRLARDVNI
jgi:hypothetical protein